MILFFFIIAFEIGGILLHVAQVVLALDQKYPEKSVKQIYGLFFENEWSSLTISIIILILNILGQFVINVYFHSLIDKSVLLFGIQIPFPVASIIIALLLGYAGQFIVYKFLGKAKEYMESKASTISNSLPASIDPDKK